MALRAPSKTRFSELRALIVLGFAAVWPAFLSTPAAAETRSFAVSWFHVAHYYGGPEDCPDGLNLKAAEFYRRDLLEAGYPRALVEAAMADFPGDGSGTRPWLPLVLTRGNRRENVYAFPDSSNAPELKLIAGKHAFGFNLDGKDSASGFEDPETHEMGVDNELYRAMGCIRSYRGGPPPDRPTVPSQNWENLRDQMPAWLISITTPDDGSDRVTVTLNRAIERVSRDANANVQRDMTYRLDPDPRSHNVLYGRIENGVITTEPANVRMLADVVLIPEYRFSQTRLRLQVMPDGGLQGMLGAYQPWYPVYATFAMRGTGFEFAPSIDLPALFRTLRHLADNDPDPKTGENRRISSAYTIEAVPAFVVPPKQAGRE